jgi:nucleoside-diphosphate-sugar epimerase
MRVAIAGGHGQIALRLARILSERGGEVVALIRNPDHADDVGSADAYVARQKKIVKNIVGKHAGIGVGKGPGVLYDQKKYDTGYIRDFLLDRGALADVSDTAAPWSKPLPLCTPT